MKSDHAIPLLTDQDRSAVHAASTKTLVYMDSNVWIDLAERFQDLANLCLKAVQSNRMLFPLSFATVHELIQQPTASKRSHVAVLMDDLSRGFCFLPSTQIQEIEADLALSVVLGKSTPTVDRDKILTRTVEFAGKMSLQFPPDWQEADIKKFTQLFAQQPLMHSVKWLVNHPSANELQLSNREQMDRYVEHMTSGIKRINAHFQNIPKNLRRKQFLLEERVSAVKTIISPRISRNLLKVVGQEKLLATISEISKLVGGGSESRLNQIMNVMPSLDLCCQLIAERVCNYSRKVRRQDFYDVEHAIVGGAYADVFATSDGNLFDLLTKRTGIPAAHGCCVVRGIEGLSGVLKQGLG